jgi:8-oxo-dGTP pyrophosphatase MutT (NUDIX family)
MTIDPLFTQIYNDKILKKIEKRFGPFAEHHADLIASSQVMLSMIEKMADKGRRGEVVMVVPNQQGQLWLHTKSFYPPGVFRLMTGGLEGDEKPHKAMLREVEEETSFKTKIDRCLAVITYTFSGNGLVMPFVSYVFLTFPTTGRPYPTDPNEAITEFRAVTVEELAETAQQLRSIEDRFRDWGVFRAIAHELTGEQLLTA